MTLNPVTLYKQIMALFKIKTEAVNIMEEIKNEGVKKSGWKTSEFWLHLIGMGAVVASAASPLIPATAFPWIAGAAAFMTTGYAVARTIAKATKTTADDEFLDALAAKLVPLIKLDQPK
jgi:hypothetical protein